MRKREAERPNGRVPLPAPLPLRAQPVQIDCRCRLKQGRQLRPREAVAELGHLAGVEVQVGHLNRNLLQGIGVGIHESVELGLGPMQRVGYSVPSALNCLDLLHHHFLRACEQTINASLDAQGELRRFHLMAKTHLFLIASGPGALELLVTSGSRQGAVPPDELSFAAKVAPPQRELDQLAHLHCNKRFCRRRHAPSFGA